MNFIEVLREVNQSESLDETKVLIEDNFNDFQYSFYNSKYSELKTFVIEVDEIFYDLLERKVFIDRSTGIEAFLEILADYFDRYRAIGSLVQISNIVNKNSPVHKRISASILYYKVNKVSKDYISRFDRIINLLIEAQEEGDYNYKSTLSFINYYYSAVSSFLRLNRKDLISELRQKIGAFRDQSAIFNDNIIDTLLELPIDNFYESFDSFSLEISEFVVSKINRTVHIVKIQPEDSVYSSIISNQKLTDFISIRQVSVDYCKKFSSTERDSLKQELENGVKIIDDVDLLYYYLLSFGLMHYYKISESLSRILPLLKDEEISVYDWGCGQSLATMVLLELIKKEKLNIKIKKITLVEPSELALKRGLVHLRALDTNSLDITTSICKDLDSLDIKELKNNNFTKLHLFSNIIDVPFFNLNEFEKKITKFKGRSYFVCISPVIEIAERKARLENFFNYFDNNFITEKICETINTKKRNKWKSNYCPCTDRQRTHNDHTLICRNAWTRHELIFKSQIT